MCTTLLASSARGVRALASSVGREPRTGAANAARLGSRARAPASLRAAPSGLARAARPVPGAVFAVARDDDGCAIPSPARPRDVDKTRLRETASAPHVSAPDP